MTAIRIQHLTKRFGDTTALSDIDLSIEAGELFFLLGPSGAGKTTLLRCLAGFCRPDTGSVRFGDTDVTSAPPHRRNIGMMFHGNALWPHLTVAENVAFGLRQRKLAAAEIRARVREALELVQIAELHERRPGALSGGQQQRVALARALAIRPDCLLLDEPLSNLEASLRQELREEIRRVSRQHRLTTVFVTHDQKEAFSISDRVAILHQGRLLQVGTAAEIYRRPCSAVVADFLGTADRIRGRVIAVRGNTVVVATAHGEFTGTASEGGSIPVAAEVSVLVRREAWSLAAAGMAGNTVRGRVRSVVATGELVDFEVAVDAVIFRTIALNRTAALARPGDEVCLVAAPADVIVLPAA